MKKLLAGLFLSILVLALAACGTDKKEDEKSASGDQTDSKENVTLKVGASNTPHAVILDKAKPILAKEGIDLEIETYTDYVLPNQDLESKDIDANYFQHIPYLELQIKDNGYDFVNAGGVHIEPIGIYSKKYKTLEDLPEGATILLSNSVSDHGRMLSLLEAKGLIKLKEGIDKTAAELKDIEENPKNFKFDANTAPEMLVQMYENDEGDAVLINSNFAIDNGLNPIEDAISLEDKESPYVNIIAVRAGDETKPEIKKLLEVLTSKEIQDFILEEWKGAVVPVK
ncbi:MetQ/NlpA family ABC transporter substrate-binding protein [Lysinibacillus sp. OL1_EC]|uniref:MetQ/NlpA family ABC transporter substrate-binding protein n=1 Tax=unclassified Lysinibacillus TaxID=2636778 RepID=UPI0010389280|nr:MULTISPECIES: MetQ/NlpA family ABC transporter substrate-binding protein [unclassified Lysinibacillus]MCM0625085.1 MetQ/NlpA family ABC transporter substrate-binding protein [Lysinibacillus sp. OL1_EC]TBV87446.1 ABC transporter substrate-binding protein [Lysinibacillus sp. OL1]UKJ44632.1 MetQ/NlpA family ABC transporter substrate-binding protein [Lysinibacillus sp. ACHW1.5]